MEKKDLENRHDIEQVILAFYEKVKQDPLIGPYFTPWGPAEWAQHLPVLYDFWENVVFHTGRYEGNPMAVHQALHARQPLNSAHFAQWLVLFTQTVAECHQGPNATQLSERAANIARIMEMRILGPPA